MDTDLLPESRYYLKEELKKSILSYNSCESFKDRT